MIGRPGAGKSTVVSLLKEIVPQKNKNINIVHHDSYTHLKNILSEDKEYKRHVLKEKGFHITDKAVGVEMLTRINDVIVNGNFPPNQLNIIEFAGGPYVRTLRYFSDEIINNGLVLYLNCPFNVCLERNRQRKNLFCEKDHVVPESVMKSHYAEDDLEELKKEKFFKGLVILENHSLDQTRVDLEKFVDQHFAEK